MLWILFSVHFINGINIILSQFYKTFLAQALVAVIYGAAFGAKVTLNVVLIRKPFITSYSDIKPPNFEPSQCNDYVIMFKV